jgi:ABC-type amino acid transport system permease subunit
VAIQEVMRNGRILSGFNFFGGVPAPVLQVFIFIGVLFIIVNLTLSRLSRRLEVREAKRTSGPRIQRDLGEQAA